MGMQSTRSKCQQSIYTSIPNDSALLEQNQYNGSKSLFQDICKRTGSLQNTEDLSFLEERWRDGGGGSYTRPETLKVFLHLKQNVMMREKPTSQQPSFKPEGYK